jgi:hypothetical protein
LPLRDLLALRDLLPLRDLLALRVLRLPPVIVIAGRTVEFDVPNKSLPALTLAVAGAVELRLK